MHERGDESSRQLTISNFVRPDFYNFLWDGPGQMAPCSENEPGLGLKTCLQLSLCTEPLWSGIAWYVFSSGITWETWEFKKSTPGKLGFCGFIWFIIKILILLCRRQGTVVYVCHEIKDVNSIGYLNSMSIWIVNEKGNVEMEKFKPDFNNWF